MSNKILIVDDEPICLKLQESITQKLGYYTQTAINGIDAINMIKKDQPDLIMLDLFMPEMDGFQTLKYLQNKFENIPIIVITAADIESIGKTKELGVNFYLQKPITPIKLQNEIEKCFEFYKHK